MSTSSFLIASIDPGGTTGAASYKLPPRGKTSPNIYYYDYADMIDGREFGPHSHHKELWIYLTNLNPDVVLCEKFTGPDNEAALLISCHYIGVVELYCELTKKPLIMRNREFKDVLWLKGDALKKLGLYHPGKPHRNDANRHLIHYVVCDLNRKEILEVLRD